MKISYFIDPIEKKLNPQSEPRLLELHEELCLATVDRTRELIERNLDIDPRLGIPSPPKGRVIHSFEIVVDHYFSGTPVTSPICDFLPWFNALQLSGEFHINYDYFLERLQTEIIIMSLHTFSDQIRIERGVNKISFIGSKEKNVNPEKNHSLRDGELSFFLKFS